MNEETQKPIVEYYEYMVPFYRMFWHGRSEGVHYGYWSKTTKSLSDSIINMNRILADLGHIQKSDRVLDAGCGVGGSAVWLAKRYGVRVSGITISPRQKAEACALAERTGVSDLVSFSIQDYLHTNFPPNSFSVVWGLESMCYAQHTANALANEMYRVLVSGGRIVIADGFVGKNGSLSEKEKANIRIFEEGFALTKLITPDEFSQALVCAGFKNVIYKDVTENILPTSRHMALRCAATLPFAWLGEVLGLTSGILTKNNRTGIVQQKLFKSRSLVYGTFFAEK